MRNGSGTIRQKVSEGNQHFLPGTKRFPESTKRFPESTKWINEFAKQMDETNAAYSEAGAHGNYVVKLAEGDKVTVQGAISIRVLKNGELNLITDQGQWLLFAPGVWKSVFPKEPFPHECEFCGRQLPYTANTAQ